MKVFYLAFADSHHFDLIKYNQEHLGWEPSFIVPDIAQKDIYRNEYPNAVIQDWFDANNAKIPHEISGNFYNTVDEDLLKDMLDCESVFYRMCDRRDFDGYSFNTIERKRHYYKLLNIWNYILKSMKPDLILFTDSPHTLWDYVAYKLALKYNIPTLMHGTMYPPGRCPLMHNIEKPEEFLVNKKYQELLGSSSETLKLSKDLEEYYESKRSSDKGFSPKYMDKILNKSKHNIFQKIFGTSLKIVSKLFIHNIKIFNYAWQYTYDRSFYVNKFRFYHSIVGLPLSEVEEFSRFPFFKKLFLVKSIKRKNQRRLLKLKSEYGSLTTKQSELYNEKFIYFPMHYQPERTTIPDAGLLNDQFMLVDLIARYLPEDWAVYVKEHPAQFDSSMPAFNTRSKYDYLQMLENKNVKLVPTSVSSFELIEKSRAVATLTGTVGLEAVIQEKPALIGGYPWFTPCEGMLEFRNEDQCRLAMKKIVEQNYKPEPIKVKTYLKALEETTRIAFHMSYFYNDYAKDYTVDYKGNIKALSQELETGYKFYTH